MLRRVLTSVVEATTGSMRKRLYVRLAAGGVVLATTIVAIALAQRATAPKETAKAAAPSSTRKPPSRSPQPIPSGDEPGNATVASLDDEGAPPEESSYGTVQDTDPAYGDESGYEQSNPAADAYTDDEHASPAYDPYGAQASNIAAPAGAGGYGNQYTDPGTEADGYGADSEEVASEESGLSEAAAANDSIYAAEARPVAAVTAAPAEETLGEETPDEEELAASDGTTDADSESTVSPEEGDTSELTDDSVAAEGESALAENELTEQATAPPADETLPRPPTTLSGAPAAGSRFSSAAPGAAASNSTAGAPSAAAREANGLRTPPPRLSSPPSSAQPLPPSQLPTGLSDTGLAAGAPAMNATNPASSSPGAAALNANAPRTLAPTRPSVAGSTGLGSTEPGSTGSGAPPQPEGTAATPGPGLLGGVQAPSLTIEKLAPAEIQVGRPATFELRIRNVGSVTAQDVVVMDRVPDGTDLVGTVPEAKLAGDVLLWQLAAVPPGGEATVTMQVTPHREGTIGSVAQVTFSAQATAQTISTQPNVILEVAAAPQVMIGDSLVLAIVLRNEGTGAAQNLFLEADVPEGLGHPAGRELENEIGTLRPGESRPLNLTLKADRAGQVRCTVRVRDDANLALVKEADVEVVAPQLEVQVAGPTLRYLQRQAVYQLDLANIGTAAARSVELIAKLPPGMKFVSADKLGQYDASRHEVFWSIDELPAQQTGRVSLTTLPVEPGEGMLRVEGFAELAEPRSMDHPVRVAAVSELAFAVSDTADPIEVGSDTVYEIEVTNRGGKADTNVIVSAQLPDELEAVNAEGPTRGAAQGQQVEFEPVPQLGPGQQLLFRITAKGRTMSDARIVIQVRSDDTPKPISKEESTRVYSD